MKRLKLEISLGQYVCFGICLLLMLIVPITRDHKILGFDISKPGDDDKTQTMVVHKDGTTVINTTEIGKDILGYGGPTPLEITIKNGKVEKIMPLPNNETPEYFGGVRNSDILESLDGLTLQEAADKQIDGVTGATYSSKAVIGNMKAGISYALNQDAMSVEASAESHSPGVKWYATLLVILCGAILPLFLKNRKYRYIQLALNVLVIGLWGGTFLSYSIMVSALTNGLARVVLIPVTLMLIVAFIYPMFGKVNHYCNWICPYGSLQELAGKCCPKKIPLTPKAIRVLNTFRNALWFCLMWLLWTGLCFEWMGYEPFAAFFFNNASWAVLAIASAFIVLSLFVQRPYCRFVCPTGTLFKLSEGRK